MMPQVSEAMICIKRGEKMLMTMLAIARWLALTMNPTCAVWSFIVNDSEYSDSEETAIAGLTIIR